MPFTESTVEDTALGWFKDLDFSVLPGQDIAPGEAAAERASFGEAFLPGHLRAALRKLNSKVPAEALDDAYRKVTIPSGRSLISQNRAFHRQLVDGIAVECRRKDGSIGAEIVRLIDFADPEANNWLVVNQLTVIEGQHNRRPDVVIFVNGLPLGVFELKNAADQNADIWQAFAQLQTYKQQVPALFVHNAVLAISDGLEARIGTISSDRERFMPWRTIDGETVAPATTPQLEVLLRGVFEKRRFLNLIRHFIVFEEDARGVVVKKMAGYHQFHAVRIAVEETLRACAATSGDLLREPAGRYFGRRQPGGAPGDQRIGVVWHTQGSGKSLTMVFYAGELVLQPAMENPTLVVLTDRNDLDDQLFGIFSRCYELLRQKPVQAESREHLKQLLQVASGGVVFTTMHKFFPDEKGSKYPRLSDRRKIVVIADEAHRSQYDFIDGFARHMRDALSNAAFIGFTGTPIDSLVERGYIERRSVVPFPGCPRGERTACLLNLWVAVSPQVDPNFVKNFRKHSTAKTRLLILNERQSTDTILRRLLDLQIRSPHRLYVADCLGAGKGEVLSHLLRRLTTAPGPSENADRILDAKIEDGVLRLISPEFKRLDVPLMEIPELAGKPPGENDNRRTAERLRIQFNGE